MNRIRRASVLIIVLWTCTGLVGVALLFGHSMLMNYRAADNNLAGRQAELAIDGTARYIASLLAGAQTPGVFPEITSYESERLVIGEATVWILGRPEDSPDGLVRAFGLVDEASKININVATAAMLRAIPGMTEELAASIIDWRDPDDEVTANGAESETYLTKNPAYACKNAPFESVEELALVHGATEEILLGEDANLNGVLDPSEDDGDSNLPPDNSDGRLDFGILEYVTTFSREPNTRADGSARININQQREELQTLLSETFGETRAQEIIGLLGANPPPMSSTLEFFVRSQMTEAEFGQIADAITTVAGDYIPGRVNIHTASEAVLACIPGITAAASSVVAARLGRLGGDTNIAWIAAVIGPENSAAAGPFITGQSWQVSADLAAVGRHGRGYRRVRVVIDQSTRTPRVIYRRNLSSLGWALGGGIREEFLTAGSQR
jgi:hypothetical protein